MSRRSTTRRLLWLGAASLLAISALGPAAGGVLAAGSIWTTREACDDPNPQNENQYQTGDHVSIRGSGFDANEAGTWMIEGQPGNASADPGQTVASGNVVADGTGAFCVDAYTIVGNDEGTYKFTALGKHDNYTVELVVVTPSPTPTPTPTPTPGATPTPTPQSSVDAATLPPTDKVSGTGGTSDSLGLVLMALAGVLASVMVLTPARARRR